MRGTDRSGSIGAGKMCVRAALREGKEALPPSKKTSNFFRSYTRLLRRPRARSAAKGMAAEFSSDYRSHMHGRHSPVHQIPFLIPIPLFHFLFHPFRFKLSPLGHTGLIDIARAPGRPSPAHRGATPAARPPLA